MGFIIVPTLGVAATKLGFEPLESPPFAPRYLSTNGGDSSGAILGLTRLARSVIPAWMPESRAMDGNLLFVSCLAGAFGDC